MVSCARFTSLGTPQPDRQRPSHVPPQRVYNLDGTGELYQGEGKNAGIPARDDTLRRHCRPVPDERTLGSLQREYVPGDGSGR